MSKLANALGCYYCNTCGEELFDINVAPEPDMETREIGRCFFYSCKESSFGIFHFTDSGTAHAFCSEHLLFFVNHPTRHGHKA